MAIEEKQLILSLDFQTDEALSRAADFRAATDANKAALAELNKTIKESGEVTKEQALQREKLEKSIRENTKARAEELRQVDNYIKATKATFDANGKYNGSIKELRANLSFLTEEWNGLTREERENAEQGGVLQKEVKRLSDELKTLEGSVGDNRRSVGGYLDAIKQAPGAMGKFRAGVDGISAAMKANPLGLIMQFLPQITALFNSSGEGADAFAEVMGSVNAVIQEGLKRLVALGGAFVKLLTGDFKGAFEDGKKSLTGFSDAITKAVTEGSALAKSLDELEARERAFGLAGAETERQINKLLIQSKNRQTSEAERIKLLERAEQLELARNKEQIALAEKRVKLVERENKSKQEDADKQDERLKAAQETVIRLQMQTDSILEKIQNRKDALADAAEDKRKKRAEADAKAAEKKAAEEAKANEEAAKAAIAALEKITEAEQQSAKDLADLKELDKKAESDELQFKINIARSEQKLRDEAAADQKKKIKENIALKEAEYNAVSTLAKMGSEVLQIVADENSEFAVFQKALTGFQIAMDMAQAISKLTATSSKVADAVAAISGPAGLVTGPLAYALYYGTQITAIASGIAQARQLLKAEPPKKMAEGGLLDGPSHAAGGIKGTGAFANVEVEGGEIIMAKGVAGNPALFALANFINQAGGGKPLGPTTYAAAGGILTPQAIQPLTSRYLQPQQPIIDYGELAKAMAAQPVYVRPTEIVSKANQTNARKASTRIG